ncbi:MAG: tyrosine-type recombinase/integrase [Candidatus Heimdallarchaeota archaeon]
MELSKELEQIGNIQDIELPSRIYRVDKTTNIPILSKYLRFVGREGAKSTIETYRITLREFLLFVGDCFTKDTVKRIAPEEVEDYFLWLDTERKIRKNTQRNKYLYLHAFFNWCVERNYINTNPVHKVKKFVLPSKRAIEKEKPKRPFFSELEVSNILKSIKGEDLISARDRVLLRFGFYCATRVGEIRALRVDCAFKNPTSQRWWINFRGKGDQRREHPIPDQVLTFLREYLTLRNLDLAPDQCMMECGACTSPYMFTTRTEKPFTTNQDVTRRLKKYVAAAGLDPARYASHSMRRSAITLMLKKGMPLNIIQKFSGHKDITILQRYLRDMPSTVEEELPRINW